jgi:hypothetical protein
VVQGPGFGVTSLRPQGTAGTLLLMSPRTAPARVWGFGLMALRI